MTDLTILFLVFGFFIFCIVLSEMASPDDSLLTFEERTRAYKESEEAVWDAYGRYNNAITPEEKMLIMKEIKELERTGNNLYSRLSREDRLKILSDIADSLDNNDLHNAVDALNVSNQKLKESNDKLRISVEKMEQRIKEAK